MKKGLIVGINYEGTGQDLRGCINDANNIRAVLEARKFDQIEMLLEKDATTANIKARLEWLVSGAQPGDVLFFHYSGHGSQLPSKTEADGWEEIICPIDLNWTTRVITDDDLRRVFNKVPFGVNTTIVLDCCHSGTGLDQDESFAPITVTRGSRETSDDDRFMEPPARIAKKLQGRKMVDWSTERDVNRTALLIATSHSSQTSADAFIDGEYQGAGTAALVRALELNPSISYKELITSMAEYMVKNRFTQRPQLDGSFGLHDRVFLDPLVEAGPVEQVLAEVPALPVEEPILADDVKDNTMYIIAGVVLLLLAFVFLS